ncbi:MAG: hypothetical protein GY754_37940 [bacterium]|nr:hypothetical protein [bacterium]
MEVKTISEKFVDSKKEQWERLRSLLLKIHYGKVRSFTEDEVREFPRFYRIVCADLAEAKTLNLSPDVIHYLNDLVGQAHKHLYSFPPIRGAAIKNFFTRVLPGTIIRNGRFVLLAGILFFGSYLLTFAIIRTNPDAAGMIISQDLLDQMVDSYKEEVAGRQASEKSLMVGFYINNNVSIAFASFAAGVLLGIGTIFFLLYNGITLGTIFAHIMNNGYGKNLLIFVTAHSVFELFGLVLAGAAGLLLGYSFINTDKYYRQDWLDLQRGRIFTLVLAGAILIFNAAFIEGFLSPSAVPYVIKLGVAGLSLLFVLSYFFIYPFMASRRASQTVSDWSSS